MSPRTVDIDVNVNHTAWSPDSGTTGRRITATQQTTPSRLTPGASGLAAVFPGQGSHRPGMASAWRDHPAFDTFAEVGRAVGLPALAELADDPAECAATDVAQPAVFAACIAAWRALADAGVTVDAVAGHSLGEIAAAVAAGSLSVRDGARVVAERGRASSDACRRSPGGMAAVLGLDADEVRAVAAGITGVSVANDNAPGQIVLSGTDRGLDAAAEACRDRGGRVRRLDVEGAFHTAAMTPVTARLAQELARTPVADPQVPMVSAATASPLVTGGDVRRTLQEGVIAAVRWRDVQQHLAGSGIRTFVEAGPGGVLRGLARRTVPDVETITVDVPDAVAAVLDRGPAGEEVA